MTRNEGALDALRGPTRYRCPCGWEVQPDPLSFDAYWSHHFGNSAPARIVGQGGPPGENLHSWIIRRGLSQQHVIAFEVYDDEE